MIVGTAGHIDHGKTTLVKALTGVDTDRLPEEKQRGISIELGYAFLDAGPGRERIGFIDVPGHERLVHTMLAGATGIDHALLLVAADDGPMPQTREHLAVLSLLGIGQGAAVITKADRVDAARLDAVRGEVRALLAASTLADAPLFTVSATTGEGIDALRGHLVEAAVGHAARRGSAGRGAGRVDDSAAPDDAGVGFRLAIDRGFVLDGVGTVVTGTVHAGEVAIGDELALVPGAPGGLHRVRSLHANNRPVDRAHAGQRCAIALAGLARDRVQRGQWLVAPALATTVTQRLDVQLTLWHGEAKALRSGTPVHVHLGAAAGQGSVAVLDGAPGDALAPGATALAQLVLHAPMAAWHGDRVVLRDASASRTIAGGIVLDPHAPARYRRTPERLAELQVLAGVPTAAARLQALVAAAPHGLALDRFAAAQGRVRLPAPPDALVHGGWALGQARADAAAQALLAALATFHERHAEELGPDAGRLRRLSLPRLPEPLFAALLARLQQQGRVQQRGSFVHLAEHGLKLSAVDERIAQKIAPRLLEAGFEGAWARDLARDCAESEPLLRTAIARLAQRGEVHQVVRDLVYAPAVLQRLAALARRVAAERGGEVTAAAFRDATALGRKRAIQVLEYFDRVGLLRRVGDVHRLRSDTRVFVDDDDAAGAGGMQASR
jgi:selenocysteine-specific elongation factor